MKPRIGISLTISVFTFALLLLFGNCSSDLRSARSEHSSSTVPGYECAPSAIPKSFPQTIDELTTYVNQLPKPLTLPCFLMALEPPLSIHATESTFSAQPSVGPENPRIFIFKGNLIISIVSAGEGKSLAEFAQLTGNLSSIKGELKFPIEGPLPLSAPYDRIKDAAAPSGGTNCRFCHNNESRIGGVGLGEAYISDVLPPNPFTRIPAQNVRTLADGCDVSTDPFRCAVLRYIMLNGSGRDGQFPTAFTDPN